MLDLTAGLVIYYFQGSNISISSNGAVVDNRYVCHIPEIQYYLLFISFSFHFIYNFHS